MPILDDLIAHPGLYIGVDEVQGSDLRGAARMVVAVLPGQIGVSIDYEILNGSVPARVLGHVEHTLLARAHDGRTVMVIADTHAGSLVTMHETEPGTFEPAHPTAYPMKVVLAMPAPGRLRHAWWYGGQEGATERDVSTLKRVE
jgi:hypothetical protein